MKTKFTQGEWVIDPELKCRVNAYAGIQIDVFHFDSQEEEAEANAKLIASAPKLFQSLLELSEFVERLLGDSIAGRPIRNKAKKALNKAIE